MKRGEIYWAALPEPAGRRPVLIVTRGSALAFLEHVTVAHVSTTVRGIRSEVPLGRRHGLAHRSAANCDWLATIPRTVLDDEPAGRLRPQEVQALDQALRFALGIRF